MSTEQFVSSTLLLLGAECGYQSGLMSAAVDNEALPLCCFFFVNESFFFFFSCSINDEVTASQPARTASSPICQLSPRTADLHTHFLQEHKKTRHWQTERRHSRKGLKLVNCSCQLSFTSNTLLFVHLFVCAF